VTAPSAPSALAGLRPAALTAEPPVADPLAAGPDPRLLWDAVRKFPTGITVVTAGSGASARGTTVSAFSYVSREPALVSVCLHRASSMLDLIAARGVFAVNVLAGHQAALARHFADPRRGLARGQFHGVPWVPWVPGLRDGVPLLIGAVCWLGCELQRRVPMGDHELVLGRVTAVTAGDGDPLLYLSGTLYAGLTRLKEAG
jgi:flavin reductase (DIM6/NTAB) family NADH-FMN oxidoreductase RutF